MLTRRERLLNIFKGIVPDRAAIKIWGVTPFQKCTIAAFEPVRELAVKKTDLMVSVGSDFNLYCGRHAEKYIETFEVPTNSVDWVNQVTIYHTPKGDLREVFSKSTSGKPGYLTEHLLKEPGDIIKLLSLPYTPYRFSSDNFLIVDNNLGDTGIAMFSLDNAMYGLVRLIGSENFALWSFEFQSLLLQAIELFSDRICAHAKTALAHGIKSVFGWVGPELCIPPLMSPEAFDIYCYSFDKRLTDIIHNGGGYVWLHCHGKMKSMIQRFMGMGVDVLNPIEPPPMGDMTMVEAFDVVGDRMALEGGIQTHDFMVCTTAEMEQKIQSTLDAGAGKRLILCPSSGYLANTEPTHQEIANWLTYINEGIRYAEELV